MNVAKETDISASRLAESVNTLPPLPATAQRILGCFGDEFIDAEKVAEVVEGDPGICAKLLGLANSAYFGLAEPVHKIDEAIARVLGVDTVRSLVLAMAIQQSFNSKGCPSFRADAFWERSLRTAEICKKLALQDDEANDADRDLAYTTGLCNNLGLMVLAHVEGERTSAVLSRHASDDSSVPLASCLKTEFGISQTEITHELAKAWSLPEAMANAYESLNNNASQSRLGMLLAASIVGAQNSLVDASECESVSEIAGKLGLSEAAFDELATFSERQAEGVTAMASNMKG